MPCFCRYSRFFCFEKCMLSVLVALFVLFCSCLFLFLPSVVSLLLFFLLSSYCFLAVLLFYFLFFSLGLFFVSLVLLFLLLLLFFGFLCVLTFLLLFFVFFVRSVLCVCTGIGEHALHRGRHDRRGYQSPRPSGVPRHRGLPGRDEGAGTTGGKRAADGHVSRQTSRDTTELKTPFFCRDCTSVDGTRHLRIKLRF